MLEATKTQPAARAEPPPVRREASRSTQQVIDETIFFDGGAGAIIRLVLGNVVLTVLTFGLYSFRGKSLFRQHFLGQTAFLGSRFEYKSSGVKLFTGYAAVMLALGGLTAAFVVMLTNLSIVSGLPIGQTPILIGAGFLYLVSMLYVFHLAAFDANRDFLAQIKWRGFATRQTGSAFGYAGRAVPYSLLVILTLGLAYPFMRNELQGYKIDHARFGKERLHYHGDADPLFRCWLLPWSIGVALMVGVVMALETQVQSLANTNWLAEANLPVHAWNTFVEEQTWLVLSGFILFSLAMYWYRSVEFLHLASNTTLARLRFASRLTHADFLIAWVNSIVLVAILGAASVAIFLAVGSVVVAFAGSGPAVGFTIAALIFSILAVIALLLGSVRWLILHNLLAGASVNGLMVKGRIGLDRLAVTPSPTSTRREPTLTVAAPPREDDAANPHLG
jgi:uncharacterized membrane protein YjgN (DUF898 family)